MDIEMTLRNYRSIGEDGATVRFRDGFTALVGMNNSGKSSILRAVWELRGFLGAIGNADRAIISSDSAQGTWWAPQFLTNGERIHRAGSTSPWEIWLTVRDGPNGPFEVDGQLVTVKYSVSEDRQTTAKVIFTTSGDEVNPVQMQQADRAPLQAASAVLSQSLYIGPFRNAISVATGQAYYDLQIGTGFVSTFAQYKSGPDASQNEAVIKLVDDVKRIFGYETLEINTSPDATTLQINADRVSLRLSELGAGIAHFIVILVNAMIRKPPMILIDEPELNLHASLQLDFLSALAKSATHGVMFATHSLGLARSSAETIVLVSKDPATGTHTSAYEDHTDLPSLAAQLGFDGRPELGFRKVLLVEGKTEVRSVLQLLRLYGKEHEIALIPLGGGTLIHKNSDVELRELQRLGDVTFLIDSEKTAANAAPKKEHADFVALCASLKIDGHMLERRAFENYLTQEALDAVKPGYTALAPYDKFPAATSWSKNWNWKAAAALKKSDVDATDLGKFIASL
jgi:ABC-type cobalamin/Fe3+-siderophores transport system ATPase subunit